MYAYFLSDPHAYQCTLILLCCLSPSPTSQCPYANFIYYGQHHLLSKVFSNWLSCGCLECAYVHYVPFYRNHYNLFNCIFSLAYPILLWTDPLSIQFLSSLYFQCMDSAWCGQYLKESNAFKEETSKWMFECTIENCVLKS
jgi:hypothetical protein